MLELTLFPAYMAVNRWIGWGIYYGKNIGRVLFALPIAGALYLSGASLYASIGIAAFVYFTRNLPHGSHYSLGQGKQLVAKGRSRGFYLDFAYMAGKGAAIFLPLSLISLPGFFIGALGWPVPYVIGWMLAKGDAATLRAEILGGVISALAVIIAFHVQYGLLDVF